MAAHSSILAWRIPRTEEPVGLPSMGLHRVGHDWSDLATAAARILGLSQVAQWYRIFLQSRKLGFHPWVRKIPGDRHGNPLHYSCLENPTDRGACWATVRGVTKSRMRLSN